MIRYNCEVKSPGDFNAQEKLQRVWRKQRESTNRDFYQSSLPMQLHHRSKTRNRGNLMPIANRMEPR
ncbi:hypothetical protein ANTPLA_LOCUS1071 [Anthophora plagiata]